MFDVHQWLNEPLKNGMPRRERLLYLLEANGGPRVHQWGYISYGAGHQRGLEQDEALELMQYDGFIQGVEACGVDFWGQLRPYVDSYRARFASSYTPANGR